MNTHKHNQTWLPQKHVFVCLLQVNEHHSVKCDCVLTVSLMAFNCLQSHLLRFNHNVSEISQHSPLHNVLAICAIQYDAQTDDISFSCNAIKPFVSEGFVKSSAKRFINNQIMSRWKKSTGLRSVALNIIHKTDSSGPWFWLVEPRSKPLYITLQTYTFVYFACSSATTLFQPQLFLRNYIVWWKNTVFI